MLIIYVFLPVGTKKSPKENTFAQIKLNETNGINDWMKRKSDKDGMRQNLLSVLCFFLLFHLQYEQIKTGKFEMNKQINMFCACM